MPYIYNERYQNHIYAAPVYPASTSDYIEGWGTIRPYVGSIHIGTNTSTDWECVTKSIVDGTNCIAHDYGICITAYEEMFALKNFDIRASGADLVNDLSQNPLAPYGISRTYSNAWSIGYDQDAAIQRYKYVRYGNYSPLRWIQSNDLAWGKPVQWNNDRPLALEIDIKAIGDALYPYYPTRRVHIILSYAVLYSGRYENLNISAGLRILETDYKAYSGGGGTTSIVYGYDGVTSGSITDHGMGWWEKGPNMTFGASLGETFTTASFGIAEAHNFSGSSWTKEFLLALPTGTNYAPKVPSLKVILAITPS